MKKIIYLFGAGASREVLPIVTEIPGRLNALIEKLESKEYQLSDTETYLNVLTDNKRSLQNELINDLKWLRDESSKHASIDTFAKKLYIKSKEEELNKLKISLSAFFMLEQLGKRADGRYDTFYASILGRYSHSFPKNIRILSWNYDFQFELSYLEYRDNNNEDISNSLLSTISKFKRTDLSTKQDFSIFKLNGSTILKQQETNEKYLYFQSDLKLKFSRESISNIVHDYCLAKFYPDSFISYFSFAWEKENQANDVVTQSIEATRDASVLVVIGYSFPFFNREVDRKIIGSMENLDKVYFQAPDADILKERFEAISDRSSSMQLVSKFDTGQFLLPNEL